MLGRAVVSTSNSLHGIAIIGRGLSCFMLSCGFNPECFVLIQENIIPWLVEMESEGQLSSCICEACRISVSWSNN